MGRVNKNLYTSGKQDWETPQALFQKLDKEFHFEWDVCANSENAKCSNYYSIEQDGLLQSWHGICWMNPPYGKDISKWVKKAYESDAIVVCLLPVRSDTKWWHQWVMKGEIRFLTKRLKFKGSSNMATFPSAIVIFGNSHSGGYKSVEI